jgi:hypothetical protein
MTMNRKLETPFSHRPADLTELRLFKIHGRQSGGIRNGEFANFARNENYFDVCTQALRLLFGARDKALFSSPDQIC